jgi:hypothetical protein
MPSWKGFDRFPGLVCILPFWMPYGFVLLRLYQGRIKSALVLAGVMGCALIVPGVFLLHFVFEWERSWWIRTNLGLALLMQPVLVAAAIRALWSMRLAPRDWLKALGTSLYGILLFALFWLAYLPVPQQIIDDEYAAKYHLRVISEKALLYAEEFDGFYPEASYLATAEKAILTGGKAECDSDDLMYLLRSNPDHGYIFEYRTIVWEISVRGCRVARSYTITARPIAYRKTGIRSFLVYRNEPEPANAQVESEIRFIHVHFTSEDRPATISDPVEKVKIFTHRYNPQ